MLGIEGTWVSLAYVLSLISTVICVVYGLVKWNADGEDEPQAEDVAWAQEEEQVEETVEP